MHKLSFKRRAGYWRIAMELSADMQNGWTGEVDRRGKESHFILVATGLEMQES